MIQSAIKYCKASLLIFMVFLAFSGNKSYGQQDKKSLSLTVQHFKIMKENAFLNITAKTKGKNGFEPCSKLIFNVYKIDTTGVIPEVKMGAVKTNNAGKAKFDIPAKYSANTASYAVKLENDKIFEDTEESLSVTNVNIEAAVEKTDGEYTIKARLLSANNTPIAEEDLKVGLKRLFGNLAIGGEDSYTTDEEGGILVPVEKGLTGTKGNLNFQVVMEESEKYGTVIANINADFGVPIKEESTFNERTMWSPPTKTPLFLLIIPNLLLVSIWSILVLLLYNGYKIYKSKNE